MSLHHPAPGALAPHCRDTALNNSTDNARPVGSYLCHTFATWLLGTEHSLPVASDTTFHHSPSL